MVSKWIIDIKGFESFRIDSFGNIWKLPFESANGKYISLKKLKKDEIKKRWELTINGKVQKWSESQLRPHLVIDTNPIVLTKTDKLPW